MRDKILIGCILCLFSFISKGAANNYIMNPYTHQEISADSIIERVMTFAPLYETIVSEYRANLYIKGKMDIQKKNFILRYVPSMFRLQRVFANICLKRTVTCIIRLPIFTTRK